MIDKAVLGAVAAALLAGTAQAGTLTPIAPYAGPGVTGMALIGINDAGWTTGSVHYGAPDATNSDVGFLRAPDGTYTLFSDQAYTQGRGIGADNTVYGFSTTDILTRNDFRAVRIAPDGTLTQLTNPAGGTPLSGIAQDVNASGAVVGNYLTPVTVGGITRDRNHGFILAGGTLTDLSAPGNPRTSISARGISDTGTVVGFVGGTGQAFVYSGGAYSFYTSPNATGGLTIFEAINESGQILGGYFDDVGNSHPFSYDRTAGVETAIVVPGATNAQTFGLNNLGQYVVSSDAGQFIYSPDGPVAPDGSSVFLPVDGLTLPAGSNQFAIGVVPDTVYYVDPSLARGFEYLSGTGPLFTSVIAPAGIGVNNMFQLWLWDGTKYVFDTRVTGGVAFDFTNPVDRFELIGIPASAGIDADHPNGFVTGLTFAGSGQFDGFQNALGAVPEPASWALMLAGFGVVGAAARRRRTPLAA